MDDKIKKLRKFIDESDNIVFFGGAGVSTESGVPDFRSKNGLYNQHDVRFERYSPEYLLSRACLDNDPKIFFEFCRQKLNTENIAPNKAHEALARLEATGKLRAIVTQNIDGLHQKAGSKKVYEIHGSTASSYCMKCKTRYPGSYIFDPEKPVPKCEKTVGGKVCGGTVRCDVTLYGESLPDEAVTRSIEAISEADLLIIGGTSLSVYPAASFIDFYRGKRVVIINVTSVPCNVRGAELLEINEKIGEVLSLAVD